MPWACRALRTRLEHSWQIAVLALSLSHFAESPINLERVVSMLLLHDIGEIDIGDTIVYATKGWSSAKLLKRPP